MPSRHNHDEDETAPRAAPARTLEAREMQMLEKAVNLAEQQIDQGTVSSQVLTHYLKLASTREMLEQRRLEKEIKMLDVKMAQVESQTRMEELYIEAINAMRDYGGKPQLNRGDDDEDIYGSERD